VHFLSSSNWWLGPRLYLSELNFSPEKLAVFRHFMRLRFTYGRFEQVCP
jgi:hypothetical protein